MGFVVHEPTVKYGGDLIDSVGEKEAAV